MESCYQNIRSTAQWVLERPEGRLTVWQLMPLKDHKNATHMLHVSSTLSQRWNKTWLKCQKKGTSPFLLNPSCPYASPRIGCSKISRESLVKWDSQTCRNHAYSARSSFKKYMFLFVGNVSTKIRFTTKNQMPMGQKPPPKDGKWHGKFTHPQIWHALVGSLSCSLNGKVGWIPY
jgi:hypothetical protein